MSDCAVLCCGPSLIDFLRRPKPHDLVIGVNRTAAAYPCGVWAFGDCEAFRAYEPVGVPVILTSRYAAYRLRNDERLCGYVGGIVFVEDLNVPLPGRYDETTYTSLVAVAYAVHRGARRITMYGCDLQGVYDWDGAASIGPNRNDRRWSHEAERLAEAAHWLGQRGIELCGLPGSARVTA